MKKIDIREILRECEEKYSIRFMAKGKGIFLFKKEEILNGLQKIIDMLQKENEDLKCQSNM